MSLVSILGRLQRRRAGQSDSDEKTKTLVPNRLYATSTPEALLDSLDENERRALNNLFEATRSNAEPFNGGNTNERGQLPCLQRLIAKQKLQRLGLPDEVEPHAEQFLNEFIRKGMEGENAEAKKITR